MIYLKAILLFLFSVGNDWLSILWHKYREERNPIATSIVAMLLGTIGWLAILWVAVDNRWLMIPDIIGTGIGSYFGVKYHYERDPIKVTPAGIALKYYGFYNAKKKTPKS